MGLQRKWNDICQLIHQSRTTQQNSSQIRTRVPFLEHFQSNAKRVESSGEDVNQYEGRCGDPSPFVRGDSQNTQRTHQPVSSEPLNHSSVTTDLGLRTVYIAPGLEPTQQGYKRSISAVVDEMKNASGQTAKPSEKDFKQLCKALAGKVRDQDDAICAISQTVARCRTGNGRRRGDIWLMFLGPDRIGKKKIATALAEVVFGSGENLISVDLNFESRICNPSPIFDIQGVNFCDSRFRGKTITDHIAEELSKKPHSVVLLEHIDKADLLAQDSLSRAIRTGKLPDTHGREISINDVIFVTTSSSCKQGEEILSSGRDIWGYSEERILNAKALQIQISVVSVIESSSSNVILVPKQSVPRNPTSPNKRKCIETNDFEITVPEVKKSKSCFDLNLPVEEAECIDNYGNNENDSAGGTKVAWLQEFLEQVDEKVVFRLFDFDSIAESMLKRFSLGFQKAFGSNVQLEIENEVMVQMLAAYWLSDGKKAVEDWMDTVLCRGLMEAKQKLCVDGESMVKLAAVEGVMVEGHAYCGCLPGRIILNQ